MAKKEETISMIDTLAEFKELKNIDKDTMISVLEDSFRNVCLLYTSPSPRDCS